MDYEKELSIRARDYVLVSKINEKNMEEECFKKLMEMIPHEHPFILSSKDIYEYITKELRKQREIKKLAKKYLKRDCIDYFASNYFEEILRIIKGE